MYICFFLPQKLIEGDHLSDCSEVLLDLCKRADAAEWNHQVSGGESSG